MEFETDSIGQLRLKLPRNGNYELLLTKKGFIDKLDSIKTYTRENEAKKEVLMTKIVAGTSFKIENVFYDFGKANLRPESTKELDKLSDFLLENDNIKVELSSHTDSRGGDAANQKLSQARAQSCVNYLLTKGIKKQNIVAKGYGETKLVNRCKNNVKCSDEEHQENRRTEIKILSVL
jgi:outer membrane protein OmpA-like peptidoglycan-associated protein